MSWGNTYLVRFRKFDGTKTSGATIATDENIRIQNVARTAHVILETLPVALVRQVTHEHLRAPLAAIIEKAKAQAVLKQEVILREINHDSGPPIWHTAFCVTPEHERELLYEWRARIPQRQNCLRFQQTLQLLAPPVRPVVPGAPGMPYDASRSSLK